MMNDIYADPLLVGRGTSAAKCHEDEDGSVYLGGTNEGARPRIACIHIHMNSLGHAMIYGGPAMVAEWKALVAEAERAAAPKLRLNALANDFMWRKLFACLTPDVMKKIISDATVDGERKGRNEFRRKFKALVDGCD